MYSRWSRLHCCELEVCGDRRRCTELAAEVVCVDDGGSLVGRGHAQEYADASRTLALRTERRGDQLRVPGARTLYISSTTKRALKVAGIHADKPVMST